jgi:hypothetical protein
MEPPSPSRDGEDEEHKEGEQDCTKIAVWTEAERASSEFNRAVEKGPEEEEEEHEEEITGLVADESALSEVGPELPGISFEFAVVAVLTSDERGLPESPIAVRAEIKSLSPWAETTEAPMLSRDDGEDEKNEGEEEGQADAEAERPCSFTLCCNSSACT